MPLLTHRAVDAARSQYERDGGRYDRASWRGRAAGRRDRGRQHHGHLRPGTPLRDRAAPCPGRHQGQIRIQFLAEAILLSLAGGAVGVAIGAAATAIYARGHNELLVIPPKAWAGGLAAAIVIGAASGLLPTIRAARLSPTQALWSI